MSQEDIAHELEHYLKLYATTQKEEYLPGILTFAGMLVSSIGK